MYRSDVGGHRGQRIWASPEAIFWAVWGIGQKKKPAPIAAGAGLWTTEIKVTPTRVSTIDTDIADFLSLQNLLPWISLESLPTGFAGDLKIKTTDCI